MIIKTLTYISWNNTEFGALGRAICGAVFLGCPHKTAIDDNIADEVSAVYKKNFPSTTKMNKVFKAHTPELCDIATMFEGIALEDLKLLTVRECGNEPVKSHSSMFRSKNRKPVSTASCYLMKMTIDFPDCEPKCRLVGHVARNYRGLECEPQQTLSINCVVERAQS